VAEVLVSALADFRANEQTARKAEGLDLEIEAKYFSFFPFFRLIFRRDESVPNLRIELQIKEFT
jgi:hypothetical protein